MSTAFATLEAVQGEAAGKTSPGAVKQVGIWKLEFLSFHQYQLVRYDTSD